MKFKKFSQKTLVNSAATVGGVVVGGLGSNIIMDQIHKPTGADPSKEKTLGIAKRGGLVAAGVILAACVSGDDLLSTALRGVGVGMASTQSVEIIKTVTAKELAVANTPTKRIMAAALNGSACGCGGQLNAPRRRTARLRAADVEGFQFEAPQRIENPLEIAARQGLAA